MKMKHLLSVLFFLTLRFYSNAQDDTIPVLVETDTQTVVLTPKTGHHKIYKLYPAVDIPVTVLPAAWSSFAFTKIYNKPPSTEEQIINLDRNDIPKFDRWAAGKSDKTADNNSDYLFYGTIPVPFLLLFDPKIRQDAPTIGYLYLEAMAITGMFYTGTVYFVDRYRPETYDTTISVSQRTSGNYKDAFMAGHPALVATGMFFTAKIYADYHPNSDFRYVFYGAAIAATGATVYLRHIAGKHFPSDLFTGVTIGTLSGILVPQFHKINKNKDRQLGILPFGDGNTFGCTLKYSFIKTKHKPIAGESAWMNAPGIK
jgi:membrane-associated phospholipid phosphatase